MSLNRHAGHRGFSSQVSSVFFGKVRSTAALKTPVRTAKAACGTVWQLLYIRAKWGIAPAGLALQVEQLVSLRSLLWVRILECPSAPLCLGLTSPPSGAAASRHRCLAKSSVNLSDAPLSVQMLGCLRSS